MIPELSLQATSFDLLPGGDSPESKETHDTIEQEDRDRTQSSFHNIPSHEATH